MPYLFGTDSNYDVPVSLGFTFNGASVDWGSTLAYHVEPLSNRAESIDGNYQISDLDVQFIDTNGSLWGSLGHGTTAFNKDMALTAYVGGTMDYSAGKFQLQNTTGAGSYIVHRGKITSVSRKNRLVRIRSKSNLRLVADLEWRFPYSYFPMISDYQYGSYYFSESVNMGTYYPDAINDRNQDSDSFKFRAAVGTGTQFDIRDDYPSIPGRGTLGLNSFSHFPGTQFYFDMPRYDFTATYLGTKIGLIESDEEARRYGYSGLAAAEAAKLTDASISGPGKFYYAIRKNRWHVNNGTNFAGSRFWIQQNLTLSESPANLFRELLTGHCVTPYFGTSDIDATTFTNAQLVTGFQRFVFKVDPRGGKVAPAIKNLMESLYGLFAVNTENQFEFRPYAPRKIRDIPVSVGSSSIVESEVSNELEDYYNRFVVEYGYDPDSGDFTRSYEIKGLDWAHTFDRPYVVSSRFIQNENEAVVFANRVLRRFEKTIPRYTVTAPLSFAGALIGSLYSIRDEDSFAGTKIVEVTGYRKDFSEDKKVQLDCLDAETLYFRKGYAYWGTKVTLPGDAVNANSDSGWGVGGTNGTCPGINYSLHGTTSFIWW